MTREELITQLIRDGHIVKLGEDNYVITNKLERDKAIMEKPVLPQDCFPQEIVLSSPSQLLKQFIKDAKIPFRAKTSAGAFYQLAAESDYARKYLYNVLATKQYPYDDMVKVTNLYYTNEQMARVTLTNFFKQGIFDQLMSEYQQNPKSTVIGPVGPKVNKVSL